MKEFVFVEFLFTTAEYDLEISNLEVLGDDFLHIKDDYEYDAEEEGIVQDYIRISGRINSATASMIKLQNPALAGRMRISYIPESLKDKYRR